MKKKKPLLHNKNAIKVSPFSCDTGCFHRTDDTTNADYKSVGYSPLFDTIIYQIIIQKIISHKLIWIYWYIIIIM